MTSIEHRVELLRTVSIFAHTDDETLLEIAKLFDTVEFEQGEHIVEAGQDGECMYIIIEGKVQVHEGEVDLTTLEKSGIIGEMELMSADPHIADATALEHTLCLRLDRQPFYQLLAERSDVARGIFKAVTQIMRALVEDVVQEYQIIQRVRKITAAASKLEAGEYNIESLSDIADEVDPIGLAHLARVFIRMASEMEARETRLKMEVQELRIKIDETKKTREISQIVDSDFFHDLQGKSKSMREKYKTQTQTQEVASTDPAAQL